MLTAEEFVPCTVARKRRGRHGGATKKVLTMEQARAIRELRAAGVSIRSIARQFGANSGTISQIVNGKTYREGR